MSDVKVLVLTGYGLNCDNETAYAATLAGAIPEKRHINDVIGGMVDLSAYKIIVFGGGFSWGDDHGAGVIFALRFKTYLGDKLVSFVEGGNLVIGICNGFQALVNLGLLPAVNGDYTERSVAITYNDCGRFRDDWVHMAVNQASPCVFTKGFTHLEFPVRHGEGKFVADDAVLDVLSRNNQVVLRYALADGTPAEGKFPENPNGSLRDIAGICDPSGRVFGLMPHPEAYNHVTNHPMWTIEKEKIKRQGKKIDNPNDTTGIRLFKNAVDFIRNS